MEKRKAKSSTAHGLEGNLCRDIFTKGDRKMSTGEMKRVDAIDW